MNNSLLFQVGALKKYTSIPRNIWKYFVELFSDNPSLITKKWEHSTLKLYSVLSKLIL